MPKARITSKGLFQEKGSGLSVEDSSTFSGQTTFSSHTTSSAGMVMHPATSGSGAPFSLDITSSNANDASANAVRLWSTGSAQGTDFGIGADVPDGAAAIYFDPHWQPVGGSATGALKVKIGSTHYVLSMSAI